MQPGLMTASNVLRTIACALVVLVHVNTVMRPGVGTFWPAGFFFAPFFAISVPAFFMLSGYYSGRFSPAVTRPSVGAFLRKKLRPLVVPFIAWNSILLLLQAGSLRSVSLTAFQLFTGTWQLYYVFALLQLLVLQYYSETWTYRLRAVYIFGAASFLTLAFGCTADYLLWTRGSGAASFMELYLNRLFLPWGMFYFCGVLLRDEKKLLDWLDRKRGWFGLLTGITFALYYWESRLEEGWLGYNPLNQFLLAGLPFRFLCPLMLLVMLNRFSRQGRIKPAMALLASPAKDTYGIYLCHTSILIGIWYAWNAAGLGASSHWTEVPIMWCATWLISWWATRMARSARYRWIGRILFGITAVSRQNTRTALTVSGIPKLSSSAQKQIE